MTRNARIRMGNRWSLWKKEKKSKAASSAKIMHDLLFSDCGNIPAIYCQKGAEAKGYCGVSKGRNMIHGAWYMERACLKEGQSISRLLGLETCWVYHEGYITVSTLPSSKHGPKLERSLISQRIMICTVPNPSGRRRILYITRHRCP